MIVVDQSESVDCVAINQSCIEILDFLDHNKHELTLLDDRIHNYSERTRRSADDLNTFRKCSLQNYVELADEIVREKITTS